MKDKYEMIIFLVWIIFMEITHAEVAGRFCIPTSTLSGIASNATNIKKVYDENKLASSCKRMRKPTLEVVDTSLLQWFSNMRSSHPDFPMSGEMLLEKAQEFGRLSDEDRVVTMSWINRWKERHCVSWKKLAGEASSVNSTVVDEWVESRIPLLCNEFPPTDIYNVDETAFFWKSMPDHTLAFRNEAVRGGKQSKERVTLLVGASMTGEKLPLLIIGRSKHPRCFPRDLSKLPTSYSSSQKGWMNSFLFEKWLRELDDQLTRRIGMVIDNCPAHPHIQGLKNIKLVFLPPNTTSKTQPMDAGVIRSLKHHYRTSLAKKRLVAYETGIAFQFDLYQCLHLLQLSWEAVSAHSIVNCFVKVGFPASSSIVPTGDGDELGYIIERMRDHVTIPQEVDTEMFVTFDDDMPIAEELTDKEIVIAHGKSGEEEEVDVYIPLLVDALRAVALLREYLVHDDNAPINFINSLIPIERHLEQKALNV